MPDEQVANRRDSRPTGRGPGFCRVPEEAGRLRRHSRGNHGTPAHAEHAEPECDGHESHESDDQPESSGCRSGIRAEIRRAAGGRDASIVLAPKTRRPVGGHQTELSRRRDCASAGRSKCSAGAAGACAWDAQFSRSSATRESWRCATRHAPSRASSRHFRLEPDASRTTEETLSGARAGYGSARLWDYSDVIQRRTIPAIGKAFDADFVMRAKSDAGNAAAGGSIAADLV